MGEVARIAHRDHFVVEEREVPDAAVDKARSVDEGASPEDVAEDEGDEEWIACGFADGGHGCGLSKAAGICN